MILSQSVIIDRRAVMLFLIFGVIGCTSTAQNPGVGDLSFRLRWTGSADVDLYVKSPLGEPINYGVRRAGSGGQLDVDCNFRSEEFEASELRRMCEFPMENIFWPRGKAPRGEYEFWLLLPNPEGMEQDDTYTLEVRFGEKVIWESHGLVAELEHRVPVHRVSFPEGEVRPVD